MKKLFALAVLSLSASAFSQICEVDMVDRYSRIVQTFRAYGDPSTCIEGMKECRKALRIGPQRGGVDCVRAASGPTIPPTQGPSYPPTNGPSNPYPPTNNYGVSVSGYIEDAPFTFTARNASELYLSCLTDIRRVMTSSADEIFFTANNNRFVSRTTSGWYNDVTICSILESEARNYGPTYSNYNRIVGSLERSPFQFDGNDRASLLNSCVGNFTALRLGSTDEMQFSVNGAPFQRITTTGWWTTPFRACKALFQNVDNQL